MTSWLANESVCVVFFRLCPCLPLWPRLSCAWPPPCSRRCTPRSWVGSEPRPVWLPGTNRRWMRASPSPAAAALGRTPRGSRWPRSSPLSCAATGSAPARPPRGETRSVAGRRSSGSTGSRPATESLGGSPSVGSPGNCRGHLTAAPPGPAGASRCTVRCCRLVPRTTSGASPPEAATDPCSLDAASTCLTNWLVYRS